jgi:hypothetical protein
MSHPSSLRRAALLLLLIVLTGCTGNWSAPFLPEGQATAQPPVAAQVTPQADLAPIPLAETIMTFKVIVPGSISADEPVILSILDEVTGLSLNAQSYPMMRIDDPNNPAPAQQLYVLTLPFPVGSVVTYRFDRQVGTFRVSEHLADGSPVRYRMVVVQPEGLVEDVVSRWTDTSFNAQYGRIEGQVLDSNSAQPVAGLLICAGGAQTYTRADGTFLLEGLPAGLHNMVAYSMDGAYQTFQQGALVAAGATTPTPLKMTAATKVKVLFVVNTPDNHPPVIPLRLAGNLMQLGNSFATLQGGISTLAVNMPVLQALPDGRYSITLDLPVGSDIHYKYTLGDGFWNAEHDLDGEFRLRQVIIPNHNVMIEDTIESWYSGRPNALTFDVMVPADTPPDDFVSIQFHPLFGWTEPIPMWPLGGNRWAYVLYSPLNLPPEFAYRYCRSGQCGLADDAKTPGPDSSGRQVTLSDQPQNFNDQVEAWVYWSAAATTSTYPTSTIPLKGPEYMAGIAFAPGYHPSWKTRTPLGLAKIQSSGANWVALAPTWTFGGANPSSPLPILAPVAGKDALWADMIEISGQSRSLIPNLAIAPSPRFPTTPDQWWQQSQRDANWWAVWFDQVRTFTLHHADLASQTGASALILGGSWLLPALPGGVLADGTPSGVPEDAEIRWRNLLAEVRLRYPGKLLWVVPAEEIRNTPAFLDMVDQVVVQVSLPRGLETGLDTATLEAEYAEWLDYTVWPVQIILGKPIILGASFPSDPDLQTQTDAYQALLNTSSSRDWVVGLISAEFYPATGLQGPGTSINGKPALGLLGYWFPGLIGAATP